MGSLNSLEDYLNASLGLTYDKKFKVAYKNSKEHREVQVADIISNVIFGYYNFRSKYSTFNLINGFKKIIISKFPYKKFEDPKNTNNQKETIDSQSNI